jgi:predicted nucleic acid-binding protein
MGVIFDTSEIITLERNRQEIDAIVRGREDEPFGISVVTVAELLHGVERADTEVRKLNRQAFVEKVMEFFPTFPFDIAVARIYARIWASLAKRNLLVSAHDLIITATALTLNYAVITSNIRDYGKIEGLKVERR